LKRRRKKQRERQRRCRNKFRALAIEPLNLASSIHVTTIEKGKDHVKKVYASMNQIALFINFELSSFGNYVLNTKVVMEKLMANCII
jgi:hypothetical protein